MTKLTALLFLVSFSLSSTVLANEQKHQDKAMMTGLDTPAAQVITSFHNALKSGDKEQARAALADNVMIFEGGNVERSADQYAHHHMLSDMKYLADMTSETLEHQVKIIGNTAISTSRSHTKGVFKGKERDYQSMETMVLENQNGDWKIIHIHWSN